MNTISNLVMEWQDDFLVWKPEDYSNFSVIHVPWNKVKVFPKLFNKFLSYFRSGSQTSPCTTRRGTVTLGRTSVSQLKLSTQDGSP